MVAAYLAKYATKATEITGHTSGRLTAETIDLYADPDGTHTERLIDACWTLGRPARMAPATPLGAHARLRRPLPHQEPPLLHHLHLHPRQQRIAYRRTVTAGPDADGQAAEQPTTLVVNFLQFVGAGWHTTGDALLANTAAARAREHAARQRHLAPALAA